MFWERERTRIFIFSEGGSTGWILPVATKRHSSLRRASCKITQHRSFCTSSYLFLAFFLYCMFGGNPFGGCPDIANSVQFSWCSSHGGAMAKAACVRVVRAVLQLLGELRHEAAIYQSLCSLEKHLNACGHHCHPSHG